jgi:hypothetical protein
MKTHTLAAAVVVTIALSGCNREAKDFEAICHVVERSGVDPSLPAALRVARMAEWIDVNVRTDRARRTFAAASGVSPEQRRAMIQRAAAEAGYHGSCPLFGP